MKWFENSDYLVVFGVLVTVWGRAQWTIDKHLFGFGKRDLEIERQLEKSSLSDDGFLEVV